MKDLRLLAALLRPIMDKHAPEDILTALSQLHAARGLETAAAQRHDEAVFHLQVSTALDQSASAVAVLRVELEAATDPVGDPDSAWELVEHAA